MPTLAKAKRDAMILEARPAVARTLMYYANRYPQHVREDAIADGLASLPWSAQHYDPAAAASFTNYAIHRAIGAMIDGLRSLDHLTRHDRQAYAKRAAQADRDGDPRPSDGAPFSLDVSFNQRGEPGSRFFHDLVADHEPGPEAQTVQRERSEILDEAIRHLPERERFIIRQNYFDGMTLREIGVILGITESRCSQLHTKALLRLRRPLARQGVAA